MILRRCPFRNHESGVVLILVLWVMVILSLLAISLGQHARIELALTKNFIGKVKSRYAVWAGMHYAIQHIQQDSKDEESRKFDTLYSCGIPEDNGDSLIARYKDQELEGAVFDVSYVSDKKEARYGLSDEERKINLNGLTKVNANILKELIVLLGYGEELAETISYSVVDWKDPDQNPVDSTYGAEASFYSAQDPGYLPKNLPFESKSELLLVRGVTPDIYNALKNYVTVFPLNGQLKINFDTADSIVLQAVARAKAGTGSQTDYLDAEALVRKIIDYRRGSDNIPLTQDDRVVNHTDMPLNAKELVLFLNMNQHRASQSNYLNIQVRGKDTQYQMESSAEAILERNRLNIVYWKRT